LLAREILRETPELSTFSGLTQEGIQKQFQEYDDRLRELQRKRIAWKASRVSPPQGNGSGRVRDYTELFLLKHEINKKKRHIPLRQLIHRSGEAISALKPCFMMGPMSVAQYLAPGQMNFDLVVMDEASQVRPEDALGAVARGGQLVVVGDPKQLPPTSFFDKLLDEEDEEEDFTAGQQSESILDAALTTFPARRLRWHYRSQHESLIAFSNHAYYGSDLVIFPSPINEAPEYGVQFTRVKRGRFVNRVNREEAELIAKAVRQHMLSKPDESLGVVAMSAQQREQIERAIEQETKEDAHFRALVDRDQDKNEPLFIKNLENVQGDERDVIYISMTYGPTEVGGRVAQRFGPINSINGWRRLNVLFTRSKKRMHVFSSMGSEDIIVSESSSRGVQSMKAFLDYAATGNLPATKEFTGRDPDSDFEVAVMEALSDHGFECQPQVGVAGYFLDIAVRDPGNRGRYLMAIECDGATYHSAKSTRDRDRLRQRVLERLGWRVRRIWSTDWFNNPAGQLKPIIDELNSLKTVPTPEAVEEYDEQEEIEELADEIEEDTEFVSTIVELETDLRTQLERFDQDVIRAKYPNTAPERRFLRPAMLDALLQYRPTTIWEFQQQIPPYLRQATEPKEGEYIKPVLEIIYESES
jgi:very-short-patch-repair endonuclease